MGARRRTRLALLLQVLFALILKQPEILTSLIQRIMLSVECVDHIILIHVNLVINVHILFNELNELLHLLSEQ